MIKDIIILVVCAHFQIKSTKGSVMATFLGVDSLWLWVYKMDSNVTSADRPIVKSAVAQNSVEVK